MSNRLSDNSLPIHAIESKFLCVTLSHDTGYLGHGFTHECIPTLIPFIPGRTRRALSIPTKIFREISFLAHEKCKKWQKTLKNVKNSEKRVRIRFFTSGSHSNTYSRYHSISTIDSNHIKSFTHRHPHPPSDPWLSVS